MTHFGAQFSHTKCAFSQARSSAGNIVVSHSGQFFGIVLQYTVSIVLKLCIRQIAVIRAVRNALSRTFPRATAVQALARIVRPCQNATIRRA